MRQRQTLELYTKIIQNNFQNKIIILPVKGNNNINNTSYPEYEQAIKEQRKIKLKYYKTLSEPIIINLKDEQTILKKLEELRDKACIYTAIEWIKYGIKEPQNIMFLIYSPEKINKGKINKYNEDACLTITVESSNNIPHLNFKKRDKIKDPKNIPLAHKIEDESFNKLITNKTKILTK